MVVSIIRRRVAWLFRACFPIGLRDEVVFLVTWFI